MIQRSEIRIVFPWPQTTINFSVLSRGNFTNAPKNINEIALVSIIQEKKI